MTRFAGSGRAGSAGDGGPASSAQLNYPMGMTFDSAGNLYVADRDANNVRRISAAGIISTVATGLTGPFAVAVDNNGTIYVADTAANRIVRILADGTPVTIAAGLNRPEGVAVDANGTVFFADTFNGRIKRIAADGTTVVVAGIGSTGIYSGDNNPAETAGISLPTDIIFDRLGSLYIADFGNGRVRKVTNGIITTVAGLTNGAPILDGEPAASVRLEGPTGIALDRNNLLYFVEGGIGSGTGLAKGDYKVWKFAADGKLATIAGNGLPQLRRRWRSRDRRSTQRPHRHVARWPRQSLYRRHPQQSHPPRLFRRSHQHRPRQRNTWLRRRFRRARERPRQLAARRSRHG